MLMYSAIDRFPSEVFSKKTKIQESCQKTKNDSNPTSHISGDDENHLLYEKSVKLFKCHRNIADTDTAIITRMAKKEKQLKVEVGEKNANLIKKVVEHMNVL